MTIAILTFQKIGNDLHIIRQLNGPLIKTIFSHDIYYYSKRGTFSDFSPSIKLKKKQALCIQRIIDQNGDCHAT
jgi:hypothetical protein